MEATRYKKYSIVGAESHVCQPWCVMLQKGGSAPRFSPRLHGDLTPTPLVESMSYGGTRSVIMRIGYVYTLQRRCALTGN